MTDSTDTRPPRHDGAGGRAVATEEPHATDASFWERFDTNHRRWLVLCLYAIAWTAIAWTGGSSRPDTTIGSYINTWCLAALWPVLAALPLLLRGFNRLATTAVCAAVVGPIIIYAIVFLRVLWAMLFALLTLGGGR